MKYAAAAAIATLTIAACGSTVTEEPQSQPAPQPEAVTPVEPVEKESATDVLGYDPEAMSTALDVCILTNDNIIDATETAMVTLDVDWYYDVLSTETSICVDVMQDAGLTITDPTLDVLWTEAIESGEDLADWTGLGWPGTTADLEETLRLTEVNVDDWADLADWAAGVGGFDV